MASLLSLITAVPSLMQAFGGSSNPFGGQQKKLADQQAEYSAALADPNNPLYQRLYGQYRNQNRQNLAQVIAELQGQNRANSALGRTPLIGGERGNETLFRQLMQGFQQSDAQANTQTQDALKTALLGSGYAAKSYSDASPLAARASAQQLSGFQGIQDLLSGRQQQPMITWNQPEPQQNMSFDELIKKYASQRQPEAYSY